VSTVGALLDHTSHPVACVFGDACCASFLACIIAVQDLVQGIFGIFSVVLYVYSTYLEDPQNPYWMDVDAFLFLWLLLLSPLFGVLFLFLQGGPPVHPCVCGLSFCTVLLPSFEH